MAKISWNGTPYFAEPVEELPGGDWHMRMQQHGPRFAVGTIARIPAKDIIEMASAEMPPVDTGLAALQAAMDADKATRPTPAQLIANWRKGKLQPATQAKPNPIVIIPTAPPMAPQAVVVPPAPVVVIVPDQQPQDTTDMSSKLSALPGLAKDLANSVDALADTTAARLQKAKAGAAGAVDKLNAVAADVETSTTAIEDVVNQMTNGGPAGN